MNGSYTSLADAYHHRGQIKEKEKLIEKFESGEHVSMADGLLVNGVWYVKPVTIPLPENITIPGKQPGVRKNSNDFQIDMDTGNTYTFGQLLALSGDFFWAISRDKQVSAFRGDDTSAMKQFLLNFNTLNDPFGKGDPDVRKFINQTDNTASDQARKIIEIINQEIDALSGAIQSGTPVRAFFDTKAHTDTDLKFVNITHGPGTIDYPSMAMAALDPLSQGGGRYLQLALVNDDHFANDAHYAYTIGHTAALIEAEKGFQTNFLDMEFYHRALAMDAMACHFLSDTFAGGHSRTNARDIRNGPGASLDWSSAIAGLLVKTQHDEENTRGLNVRNAKGVEWITYGDKNLFRPENAASRTIQQNAIQSSIDEIWLAFNTGVITLPINYKAVSLIPLPGNPGSTLTPTGGYTGDIVYLDNLPGSGTSVCDAPDDCSDLGPPELWGNIGTSACSTSGHKRMCQRVKDLNDYAPFFMVSDNKLWRRQGRDRDIPEGKQMTQALSAISAERAYANAFEIQPSPILPPTSQDSVAYFPKVEKQNFPKLPCCYNGYPNCSGVWDEIDDPNTPAKTWSGFQGVCEAKGQRLCDSYEMCLNGQPLSNLDTFDDDNWMAVADKNNEWVTYNRADGRLCKTHTEVAGTTPTWGNTTDAQPWYRGVKCCPGYFDKVDLPIGSLAKNEPIPPSTTWSGFQGVCEAKGLRICNANEMCLNGQPLSNLDTFDDDNWMAVGDQNNEWVTYNRADGRLCKTHTQVAGTTPTWGNKTDAQPWYRGVKCCPGRDAAHGYGLDDSS